MTPRIILIEGVDYVGKTTFAKGLCNAKFEEFSGAIYQHTPLHGDVISEAINTYVKDHPQEISTRKIMSVAENALAVNYCNSLKHKGTSVVLDRNIFSFLAYQNVTVRQWGLMKGILDFPVLECDGVFILDATRKELEKRHNERTGDSLDEYFMTNFPSIVKRYKEAFLFHSMTCENVYCLNTTGKTPKQSIDEAGLVIRDWFHD